MDTAKIFENGGSQAVRLPKKYRFEGTELIVQSLGKAVLLVPKEAIFETFIRSLDGFSEDFLCEGRPEEYDSNRDAL